MQLIISIHGMSVRKMIKILRDLDILFACISLNFAIGLFISPTSTIRVLYTIFISTWFIVCIHDNNAT